MAPGRVSESLAFLKTAVISLSLTNTLFTPELSHSCHFNCFDQIWGQGGEGRQPFLKFESGNGGKISRECTLVNYFWCVENVCF